MRGIVNSFLEPVVSVRLVFGKRIRSERAVIDTGFNGYLCVPEKLAKGWVFFGYENYEIATGEIVRQKVYLGQILWRGNMKDVYCVTSHANDILIGTKMLAHSVLKIDFPKKRVLIE